MTGALSAQQGPFGVAANPTRPVEKPEARSRMRVDDSTRAELGHPSTHRTAPRPGRRLKSEQDQTLEPRVAAATLLEASLLAATLVNAGETRFAPPPLRAAPWQPPSSSLPLRDRSV